MKKDKINRREFFRTCARTAVAGGLAALGIMLATRKTSANSSEKCSNNGICRNCGVLANCNLPAALSLKRAQQNGERNDG